MSRMSLFLRRSAAMAVVVLSLAAAQSALAQSAFKIGTFDKQRLVDESKLGQGVKARFEKLQKAREAELDDKKKAYDALQSAYEQQSPVLSDEKKLERQRELAREHDELQSDLSNADRDLERAYNQSLVELVQKLDPVIQDFAKSEGYDMLFDQQQYAFAKDAMDITDKLIAKINTMFPGDAAP
jgi:outer membrane protein